MSKIKIYPIIEEVKSGWAAKGDGWAVHAPTKESVIEKYEERKKYYKWLDSQPLPDKTIGDRAGINAHPTNRTPHEWG